MNALSNSPAPPASRPLVGVAWMLLTGALFVAVTATVKHMGHGIPAAQSAFLRYLMGLAFLLPMLPALSRAKISRRELGLFGLRGFMHALGIMCWFYAMTRIALAEVTAMMYLSPVFVTIGAAVFLGERLRLRRVLAVGAAVLGALIILRPGVREVSAGHLAMLGTGVTFAISYLITKRLTERASATVVVAMLSLVVPVALAPFAWVVWVPVTVEQLGWLFLVALFATAGHYTMTLAIAAAPISVTQPVTAVQLIWAVILGAVAFGEPVDPWVVAGGAVIASAVVFIALREHAQARSRTIPPPTPPLA